MSYESAMMSIDELEELIYLAEIMEGDYSAWEGERGKA